MFKDVLTGRGGAWCVSVSRLCTFQWLRIQVFNSCGTGHTTRCNFVMSWKSPKGSKHYIPEEVRVRQKDRYCHCNNCLFAYMGKAVSWALHVLVSGPSGCWGQGRKEWVPRPHLSEQEAAWMTETEKLESVSGKEIIRGDLRLVELNIKEALDMQLWQLEQAKVVGK